MFVQEEHDINSNNYKKNNDDLCLTFYVTKMKDSKGLQRQRNKGKIKKQF